MSYHLELTDGSVWKPDPIHIEGDDLACIDAARIYSSGLLRSFLWHLSLSVVNEQLAEFRIGESALNHFCVTNYDRLQLARMEMSDRCFEHRVGRYTIDVLAIGIVVVWRQAMDHKRRQS